MATQLQIRRGTSTQVAAFTGAEGEIVVNTTNDSVHVNDGSTQGGFELARVDGSNWAVTNSISIGGSTTVAKGSDGASILTLSGAAAGRKLDFQSFTNSGAAGAGFDIDATSGQGAITLSITGTQRVKVDPTGIDVTGAISASGDLNLSSAGPGITLTDTDNNPDYQIKNGNGSFRIIDTTASQDRINISSSAHVGINNTAPEYALDVDDDTGNAYIAINRATQSQGEVGFKLDGGTSGGDWFIYQKTGGDDLNFYRGSDLVTIKTDGKFGVGTTTPDTLVEMVGADPILTIRDSSTSSASGIATLRLAETGASDSLDQYFDIRANAGKLEIVDNWNEGGGTGTRVTVSDNGSVGIGRVPRVALDVAGEVAIQHDTTYGLRFYNQPQNNWAFIGNDVTSSAADLRFGDSTGEVMRLTGGKLGIGITPATKLDVNGGLHGDHATFTSVAGRGLKISTESRGGQNDGVAVLDAQDSEGDKGIISLQSAGTETMRVSSSQVLIGQTSGSAADEGVIFQKTGEAFVTNDGDTALYLRRKTSDGEVLRFSKNATKVGNIGIRGGTNLFVVMRTESAGDGCGLTGSAASNGAIIASDGNGDAVDNHIDLGAAGTRFDDVFSTGGINTSDRNEKQDIEDLSDAEKRVAVACKALIKKFRWKSSVAEKGDDSRIHVGIIAQDLRDAFTAEGLDPARYSMWCSDTWTDETSGEEVTRQSVRYNELLAFIISAI